MVARRIITFYLLENLEVFVRKHKHFVREITLAKLVYLKFLQNLDLPKEIPCQLHF
jgi:hypothetical protein